MPIRQQEVTADDLASIERAATDYIEAWLTGDADRMADCLHPDLTKRSIVNDATSGRPSVDAMTHRDMVEATQVGRGTTLPRDFEVTIENAFRNIATARLDSARYVDFLHIARFEGRWRIVNVLWEPKVRE
jgi:putative lumazine-binding protein